MVISLVLILVIAFGVYKSSVLEKIIYPYPHRNFVEKYAEKYGVDPYLVIAVIREESKFLPQSESNKGAIGLMQLMPSTARSIAESIGDTAYTDDDLLIPEKNIQYGTWYLASLEKAFPQSNLLVIAAYNAGMGHMQEWINTGQIQTNKLTVNDIPFKETRDYTSRVLHSLQKYMKLYSS